MLRKWREWRYRVALRREMDRREFVETLFREDNSQWRYSELDFVVKHDVEFKELREKRVKLGIKLKRGIPQARLLK